MRKLAAAAMAIITVTVGLIAGASTAGASATHARHHTPAQIACHQFARWQAAPTYRNLRALVIDSFSVRGGSPGLASDIGLLYANARAGGDIDVPDQYVADDCGFGGM